MFLIVFFLWAKSRVRAGQKNKTEKSHKIHSTKKEPTASDRGEDLITHAQKRKRRMLFGGGGEKVDSRRKKRDGGRWLLLR